MRYKDISTKCRVINNENSSIIHRPFLVFRNEEHVASFLYHCCVYQLKYLYNSRIRQIHILVVPLLRRDGYDNPELRN